MKKHNIEEIKKLEYLTVTQVAVLLQISRPSVYQLINNGTLKRFKLLANTRIRMSDIKELLK